MTMAFDLFDTPVGTCGIAWGDAGITGLQLPEASPSATLRRLARRFPGADRAEPGDEARAAIEGIDALLRAERPDLDTIRLDLDGLSPFDRSVYVTARAIPPAATRTYGQVAAVAGGPGSARAVGQALGRNPIAILIPCHRVVAAGGRPGGFSARGGAATKRRLLDLEAGRCLW